MKEFRTGSVVKAQHEDNRFSLYIITGISTTPTVNGLERSVNWISFDHSNSSGSTRIGAFERDVICHDCHNNGFDTDCKYCTGTGSITVENKGTDCWILLADNVQDYIISRLTKNFDF